MTMEKKARRSPRKSSKTADEAVERDVSPDAELAIRTQPSKRIREKPSSTSLSAKVDKSKKPRLRPSVSRKSSALSTLSRPGMSRNSSALSVKHLQIPQTDDVAITSGDEADSVMGSSMGGLKPLISAGIDEAIPTEKPDWVIRHRIFVDNELISTTTSTQKPGVHKFQDVLLREQVEVRLHTPHDGQQAHFATRHAFLRFWHEDGTLAEKWMDKDYGGTKEHEFALENMNDWVIAHLSMGGEDSADSETDEDQDISMEQTETETAVDEAQDEDDNERGSGKGEILPSMDIIAHYLTDYHDARNIASAPGMEDEDEASEDASTSNDAAAEGPSRDIKIQIEDNDPPSLTRNNSVPIYHWVEDRRRSLEHQLRSYFHCTTTSCFNKGGTCLVLSPSQHLHVGVKDLTDWSQQIAHAHRSIAATTLHLAAKLVDDQVRAQDERLADVGREREDEDDLGAVLDAYGLLADLRPAGKEADAAELEMLD